MNQNPDMKCCICGGAGLAPAGPHYLRCNSCGHEVHAAEPESIPITNERLDRAGLSKATTLDRFKRRVLERCAIDNSFLLDVGSGSGRFLFRNRDMFTRTAGIEIDPGSVAFARDVLGLTVAGDVSELPPGINVSVAAFWHSLEHMGIATADRTLRGIVKRGTTSLRVMISVPCGDSRLFRLFGTHAAYYDPATHTHQFTAASLDILMRRYGLVRRCCFHSFAYAWFGWLQSMLNFLTRRHNRLYMRLRRNTADTDRLGPADLMDIALASLLLPAAMLAGLFDRGLKGSGGVLTACYSPARAESTT